MHIFKIDLHIDDMIHGESRGYDASFYVVEGLANLICKIFWDAAVRAERRLARDVDVVARVDSRGAECCRECVVWRNRSNLSLPARRKRQQQGGGQNEKLHATFPL